MDSRFAAMDHAEVHYFNRCLPVRMHLPMYLLMETTATIITVSLEVVITYVDAG